MRTSTVSLATAVALLGDPCITCLSPIQSPLATTLTNVPSAHNFLFPLAPRITLGVSLAVVARPQLLPFLIIGVVAVLGDEQDAVYLEIGAA